MEALGTTQDVLNRINANPCSAFDPTSFVGYNDDEIAAMRRAWDAAIFAAALAIAGESSV